MSRTVSAGLQAVGAVALVVAAIGALLYGFMAKGFSASRVDRELVSPDGKYRAIQAATSTGSVGYCHQFVLLIPAERKLTEAPSFSEWKDQALVAVQCGDQMQVEWLDNTSLKIVLRLVEQNNATTIRVQRADPASRVLVKYEITSQ